MTALLDLDDLEARGSYRPKGEEVDGSFVLDGRVLLFEAKWTESKLPASSIYAFKGKVDGKLVGTIGVYISMAGFSQDTIDALATGKDLNVILVDEEDLNVALDVGPRLVLRHKLRAAAERGSVYFPARAEQATSAKPRSLPVASFSLALRSLAVVVEGRIDRAVVAHAAARLLRERRPEATTIAESVFADVGVDVIAAGGLSQLAAVAAALLDTNPSLTGVAVIVDGDYEDEETRKVEIATDPRLVNRPVEVIVAQPTVPTAWVGTEPADAADLQLYLAAFDARTLDDLRDVPSFAAFARVVEAFVDAAPPP